MDSLEQTGALKDLLKQFFPSLREPELLDALEREARVMKMPEHSVLIDYGRYVNMVPLLTEGLIKINHIDEDGNEVFLYYLYPGQTCAMSLNCCMGNSPSTVKAVCEEESLLISVPVRFLDEWSTKYKSWKEFIMRTYQQRFDVLLKAIDEIAFKKLDERVWNYLQNASKSTSSKELKLTHQAIAEDLNSSREVISRLLKKLEALGKIELGRNRLKILE